MVLLHGGSPRGAERIAACWADSRKMPQVVFKPTGIGTRTPPPLSATTRCSLHCRSASSPSPVPASPPTSPTRPSGSGSQPGASRSRRNPETAPSRRRRSRPNAGCRWRNQRARFGAPDHPISARAYLLSTPQRASPQYATPGSQPPRRGPLLLPRCGPCSYTILSFARGKSGHSRRTEGYQWAAPGNCRSCAFKWSKSTGLVRKTKGPSSQAWRLRSSSP